MSQPWDAGEGKETQPHKGAQLFFQESLLRHWSEKHAMDLLSSYPFLSLTQCCEATSVLLEEAIDLSF